MEVYFLVFLFICTYTVLFAVDDNEMIPYQSFCDPLKNNGECSDNFNCRCSTVVPTGERICTLQVECSLATPCNSADKCDTTDSICVIDNRCNGQHLCYPVSLTSPDMCPPLATNDNINNVE
ncbi:unnamed protein product [Rotaria sordida]|uniref:Uncharacterized protein n=1 Tax=Rotaria sordida TaxID=392033 RepID=A0A815V087_9BILA|nr:unnamed protein product [Rotaria sordida]CAF1523400.1 unnamed protein product [Rotaria sordida]